MVRPASTRIRRGFFFTIMALVLVSFIFVSIQLWVQAQSQEEARMAERFRIEALHTSLGIVSEETVARFVNASAMYAVNRLGSAIEDHPSCNVRGIEYYTGPGNTFPDGTYYLNSSMYGLIIHGSTSGYLTTDTGQLGDAAGRYFYDAPRSNLTYTDDERKYSLDAFFNRTRAAVRLLGYDVSWGEAEDFTFNQTDAWTLQVNMTVAMNFTDPRGWVNVTKRIPVVVRIPIDGFTDPSVLRADMKHRDSLCSDLSCSSMVITNMAFRPHRNVYRALDGNGNPTVYNDRIDAQAILKSSSATSPFAYEGLGWFFGPVSTVPRAKFFPDNVKYNLSRIRTYIFMTDSPDLALAESGNFGGIILTKQPTWGQTTWDDPILNCRYTNHTQENCIFCIRWQEANESRCPILNPFITPESIPPANPHIPWIAVDGDPTFGVPVNYHLQLPEVLISNEVNATDLCGAEFNATNRDCVAPDPASTQLEKKFADDGAGHSASKVWDLTGPRDMAICGFYVRSSFSPSYSQRFTYFWPHYDLVKNQYSRLGQGIESFVVGKWAGGAQDSCAQNPSVLPPIESHSRLDYQFYADDYAGTPAWVCAGPFVRGLPGCRSLTDCMSEGPLKEGTGHFAISHPDYSTADRDVWPTYSYNVKNLTIVTTTNPGTSQCR